MSIAKQQVINLIKELPEKIDIDVLMYRLYLRQKLEAAEEDVREGRLISHEEVMSVVHGRQLLEELPNYQ
ncbi:MAG: hypothetical protein WA977_01530 [Halobacteriota archaeon]